MGNHTKEADKLASQKPVVDSHKKEVATEHPRINTGSNSDKKQEKHTVDEDLTQSKIIAETPQKSKHEEATAKWKTANEQKPAKADLKQTGLKPDVQHAKK